MISGVIRRERLANPCVPWYFLWYQSVMACCFLCFVVNIAPFDPLLIPNGRDFRVTEKVTTTTLQPSEGEFDCCFPYGWVSRAILTRCCVIFFFFFVGMLRLVGGQHRCEGRVEIYTSSVWGTICDDAWDLADAQVVCHQLGCGEATAALGEAYFGPGMGRIQLDNLKCTSAERSLLECSHIAWNVHNCDHSEDAGVTCSLSWLQQDQQSHL